MRDSGFFRGAYTEKSAFVTFNKRLSLSDVYLNLAVLKRHGTPQRHFHNKGLPF